MIRFRVIRFTGDEPTKRAFGDEKQYALSKQILQIKSNGSIYTDTQQIVAAFEDHYKILITTTEPTDDYEGKAE